MLTVEGQLGWNKMERWIVMKRKGIMLLVLTAGICFGGLFLSDNAEAASRIKIDKKHFPGKIFRSTIKEFDTNKDGYLSTKEREAVKRIELYNGKLPSDETIRVAPIVDMKGLEYFAQTEELKFYGYRLRNLKFDSLKELEKIQIYHCRKVDRKKSDGKFDFTKNSKLKEVTLMYIGSIVDRILFTEDNVIKKFTLKVPSKMKKLDLSRLSQVEELSVEYGSVLESINLKECISLKKAWITKNKRLTKLDFSASPNLEELSVYGNHLVSLDISKNAKLRILNVSWNYLSELDISQNTELQEYDCGQNMFETLDISMLEELCSFDCDGLKLQELNLAENSNLEYLSCSANQLETLDLSANPNLLIVNCNANPLEKLDVSVLPALSYLRCEYTRLTSLDISKNRRLVSLSYSGDRIPSIDWTGILKGEPSAEWIEMIQETQLLPPVNGKVEKGTPIDKEHFPDYALRYEVLADFDTNHDGVLSKKESLAKRVLNLKEYYGSYRREIDCTGMEYLKGITEVKSYKETTLFNNTFQK